MRYVVTGAAGFIGSNLVDRLLDEGHEVLGIDDLSTGRLDNLGRAQGDPKLTFVESDIVEQATRDVVAAYQGEVIFHLAARMDVRHSVADPLGDARANVLGSVAMFEAARLGGVRKVVFTSSGGTIYGDQQKHPIDESAALDPQCPYAAAKISGEHYLRVYRRLCRLETTALALGNVYGPRQDPNGEAGVVSIFASALLEGRPTVIFGDGEATRDYVYIDDVVEALLRSAGTCGDGLRLNIGTGCETSVRALHRLIAEVLGRPDTPVFRPLRAGELQRVVLDPTAAERVLDWRPRTKLFDGLLRTVAWLQSTSPSLQQTTVRHKVASASAA
jgi:UDP-glucose 4-epimerase